MAKTNSMGVRLRVSVIDAQDKLRQQIAEGEAIRNNDAIFYWDDLEELKSEKKIWIDYTSEVLKALFEVDDYARDFDYRLYCNTKEMVETSLIMFAMKKSKYLME